MPDPTPRDWTRTYLTVLAVQALVLLGLLWLQRHYGI